MLGQEAAMALVCSADGGNENGMPAVIVSSCESHHGRGSTVYHAEQYRRHAGQGGLDAGQHCQ